VKKQRQVSSTKSATPPDVFGLSLTAWIQSATAKAGSSKSAKAGRRGPVGRAIYVGAQAGEPQSVAASLGVPSWLAERAAKKRGEPLLIQQDEGPVWLLLPAYRPASGHHGGLLDPSPYGRARDVTAGLAGVLADFGLAELQVQFHAASDEETLGALVGLETGAYRFRHVRQPQDRPSLPRLVLDCDPALVDQAASLGVAVNLARHLVNLPAGDLNPTTYAAAAARLFAGSSTMKVETWTGKRLETERMNLLVAVGQAAEHGPALVHLRYRPKGRTRSSRPLAFVGKGITFDTGGLDIKPASGMRMMKKDMGGSASTLALAYWAERTGLDLPCDFYLALADNAVDGRSFRPGDVFTARSGQTVEIDNTDAEGRLVLADAIDVAVSAKGKDAPAMLIDMATLTGAMRVALGPRIGGLFATHDGLAEGLLAAGQERGETAWRMPLYTEYMSTLKSTVADVANSGPGGFGGAITAALFLSRFVGATPWAHLDIYCWTDGSYGGVSEAGGSGQFVQALAEFLETHAPEA